jgi:hypothetical protein
MRAHDKQIRFRLRGEKRQVSINPTPPWSHHEGRLAFAAYVTGPRAQVSQQQLVKLRSQAVERNRAWNPEPHVLSEWPDNLSNKEVTCFDGAQFRCPAERCL